MEVMPIRIMGTKILGCSPSTEVKASKRGCLGFGCSQKGWVTPLWLWFKAVAMACLLQRGRQDWERCCCSGSGHTLVPPVSQGWVTFRGHQRGCSVGQLVGGGDGAVFFLIPPGRGVQLCSEPSLREGRSRPFRSGVKLLLANLSMTLCPSSSLWECQGAQQPGTAGQGTACPVLLISCMERKTILIWAKREREARVPCKQGRGYPATCSWGRAATALVSWTATPKTCLPLAGCSPKARELLPELTADCWSCQDSFPRDHPS